jgi:DNA helicase-2/ATP-dependent DNA helicase PcrA
MQIIHLTEQEERDYLDLMLQQLDFALRNVEQETSQFSREFRADQAYLYDQRSGMDEADVVSAGQSFSRMAFQGEAGIAARRKLMKLAETPYFGYQIIFGQVLLPGLYTCFVLR